MSMCLMEKPIEEFKKEDQSCASGNIREVPLPICDISYLERLNTVSQMAASVAHEIRNPMTTVRGYLQFFSGKEDFVQYKEQFGLIISELDRANLIIKEYLSLSQNKVTTPELCQLNSIISSIHQLLKADSNSKSKDVTIHLNDIPKLYLDEKEIRQLILNMVRNGLEAMEGLKGRTTVAISTYLDGDYVIMAIKDQGCGIPPNILKNIGKAYLTTKEQGTGLGLVICYKIAANHRAQILIDTSSEGTNFIIKFPLY